MSIIINVLLLLTAIMIITMPQRTVKVERRILRFFRLISRKCMERPPTNAALHFERFTGAMLLVYAITGAMALRITTAAPVGGISSNEAGAATEQTSGSLEQAVATSAQEYFGKNKVVGLAIGVVDGGSSFTLGLGEIKSGSGIAPNEHTLYEIGSITKTFTSLALAELVLQGRLRLDQPVHELLKDARGVPSFGGRNITLVDLATHTSGLPRLPDGTLWKMFIPGFSSNPYKSYAAADMYNFLASHKLRRSPGEKFEYSNVGAGLLGFAICNHRGQTYDKLIRELITTPLGMTDTSVLPTDEQKSRLARGYAARLGSMEFGLVEEAHNWDFQDTLAGGGAIKSTTSDMIKYLNAHLGITTSPCSAACEYSHETRFSNGEATIGLAWIKSPVEGIGEVILHNGGTGGYSSLLAMDTKTKTGVVVLSNTAESGITAFGLELLKLVATHAKVSKTPPVQKPQD